MEVGDTSLGFFSILIVVQAFPLNMIEEIADDRAGVVAAMILQLTSLRPFFLADVIQLIPIDFRFSGMFGSLDISLFIRIWRFYPWFIRSSLKIQQLEKYRLLPS
ncbi:hypothetical protein D3C74_253990 [compost metagenome]